MSRPVTNAAGERAAVFLSGSPLDIEAGDLGTHTEWADTARHYLRRVVGGSTGAGTVRVSSAALIVLLDYVDRAEGSND